MKRPANQPLSLRPLFRGGRALLTAAIALACLQTQPSLAQAAAPPAPNASPPTPDALFLLQRIEEGLAVIAKEVNRSVVAIEGKAARRAEGETVKAAALNRDEKAQKAKSNEESVAENDFSQLLRELTGASIAGSGFLISEGYVVTTADVANRIKEPMIVLEGGERVSAELVKADKESNIALLKIANAPEKAGLKWGDSDKIQPGYFAITLGNQGGFANSISLGLIAGKGRAGTSGEARYNDLIQFQGIVGKGGSGSPLINAHGEVIGMVVATPALKVSTLTDGGRDVQRSLGVLSVGVSNVGFAIPSNELKRVVELLKKRGVIAKQGWLGVNLTVNLTESLKNPARIIGVYSGGPAFKAGLRFGDVVTALNGVKVANASELRTQLRKLGAGEAVRIAVVRNGSPLGLTATIEPRPDDSEILRMRILSEPNPGN